jgi:hypothetical protein
MLLSAVSVFVCAAEFGNPGGTYELHCISKTATYFVCTKQAIYFRNVKELTTYLPDVTCGCGLRASISSDIFKYGW